MIEILSAIGLLVVIGAICAAFEPRLCNRGSAEPHPAQIPTAIEGAINLAREAMEAGDQELAHYWFEYSRELERQIR
jgi:hypothetical protein